MSEPKPRIQLSCEQGAFAAYADAVTAAGGLPCPGYAPEPDLSCAGLVLCGGGDLDPELFGWPQAGGDPPDRVRDLAEVNLFRAFYLAGRPILGICRGMQVIAAGRVTVFPRDGQYQLYCVRLTPEGAGDLHLAFEQLKEKLYREGLFDSEHKKPLPKFPNRIAVVTSAAGAAVHDMIRILRRRYPLAKVILLPVRVQGAEAPAEIAGAIRYADQWKIGDVIITGRGGGSMEDLWAFNDERVARAIYACETPVISAVGHETDVTVADYVADLRAPTPSAAAELAVDAIVQIRGQVELRDETVSLRATEMQIPTLEAEDERPLVITLPPVALERQRMMQLGQVLANHPGYCEVHLAVLDEKGNAQVLTFGDRFRVKRDTSLFAEIKILFGPSCLPAA